MNIDPNRILDLIKDKKGVIKKMLEIIDRNQTQVDGCNKLFNSINRKEDPNHSQANMVRCLEVSLSVSAKNSQDLMDMAQLLLIYAQSDGFTADVAKMASKLGKGDEALRAMFEAKLKGK